MSGNLINVKCNFFSFNRRNCQLLAHFVSKWTDHLINKLSNKQQQMLWCNSTIMSLTFLMDLLGRSSYKGFENFVFLFEVWLRIQLGTEQRNNYPLMMIASSEDSSGASGGFWSHKSEVSCSYKFFLKAESCKDKILSPVALVVFWENALSFATNALLTQLSQFENQLIKNTFFCLFYDVQYSGLCELNFWGGFFLTFLSH